MITIRKVSAEEFAELYQHTGRWYECFLEANCPGEYLGFNRGFYREMIKHQMALILVPFDGDQPIGWCMGYCSNNPYNKDFMMLHDSLYIFPEYRNGTASGRLIKAFEQEAAKLPNTHAIVWSINPGSPFERTLERHYKLYCKSYIKEF